MANTKLPVIVPELLELEEELEEELELELEEELELLELLVELDELLLELEDELLELEDELLELDEPVFCPPPQANKLISNTLSASDLIVMHMPIL